MNNAILMILIAACAVLYIKLDSARDELVALEALSKSIIEMKAIEKVRDQVDTRLKKGGADENLSDYGRDAASVLWPE